MKISGFDEKNTGFRSIKIKNRLPDKTIFLLNGSPFRAVARSENPVGLVLLGGDNVPLPLVEIELTDLPKTSVPFQSLKTVITLSLLSQYLDG